MNHVGTICTHCGDGCKTTLACAAPIPAWTLFAATIRDKNGINGDFLCHQGPLRFDFFDPKTPAASRWSGRTAT